MSQISNLLKKYQLSDIEATDLNGNTILHFVVKNNESTPHEKIKVLETLLNKGIDPKIKNKNGETVLHTAVANRDKNVIEFLLTLGMELDYLLADYVIYDEHYRNIKLTHQVKSNRRLQKLESESANFIEWILSKGLDIDGQNRDGCSTLILAIQLNLQHILPALLKYTNEMDYIHSKTNDTLLHMFLRYSGSKRHICDICTDCMICHDCDNRIIVNETWYPNYNERNAMNVIRTMLDKGVPLDNVDDDGNTALHVAVIEKAKFSIIEMLIERSSDANSKNFMGETPLFRAIYEWAQSTDLVSYNDHFKISCALIAKGADVNEPNALGTKVISHAIVAHNLRAVEFLQEQGIDLKITVSYARTLLHLFHQSDAHLQEIDNEQIKLFHMLINNGCDVNAEGENKETALHIAANRNHTIFVEKLIEAGSNVDAKDIDGNTPLHSCATSFIGIFSRRNTQMLIEHGAEIDARNNLKQTPLHLASFSNNIDTVKFLLEHGANLHAKNSKGFTVLRMSLHVEMIKFLLKYGADFDMLLKKKHLVIRKNLWPGYDENEDMDSDDDTDENDEEEFLFKHWIKLDVAKLKCFTLYEYQTLMKKYENHFKRCLEEIEILKKTKIDGNTSLYTFLHMNLNSRRAYIHNVKLKNLVQSDEQFPEYSILIFSSYREAITRKSLMHPAKAAWLELTNIRLPEICIELIFSFLSNSDLYEIIGRN